MNPPNLSVEIINSNLDETLSVLQGISRYIESIFITKKLVDEESWGVLNFLFERYPNKKIILNITDSQEKNEFISSILKNTKINNFLISGSGHDKSFKELCVFLQKSKKKIIYFGKEFDIPFLKEMKIKNLFYFKAENKKKKNYWSKKDIKNIENLTNNDFLVTVGNITAKDIENLNQNIIQEFVVSEEVCYSFNPIVTCKLIYSEIKKYYPKEKK